MRAFINLETANLIVQSHVQPTQLLKTNDPHQEEEVLAPEGVARQLGYERLKNCSREGAWCVSCVVSLGYGKSMLLWLIALELSYFLESEQRGLLWEEEWSVPQAVYRISK